MSYPVVTLLIGFFCGCRGFCHRTESDLFLFFCYPSVVYELTFYKFGELCHDLICNITALYKFTNGSDL